MPPSPSTSSSRHPARPASRPSYPQAHQLPTAPSRRRIMPTILPHPSYRANEDLRRYLGASELPSISRHDRASPYFLPARGRRSHRNKLRVRADPERRVERIRRHESKAFDEAIQKYHKEYIYGPEGPPFAGKHYTHPHRPTEALVLTAPHAIPESSYPNTPYPSSLDDTCRWLRERPLKTMQRAVHLAFPDTTRWWLEETGADARTALDDVANQEMWRSYVWRFHPDVHQPTWWRDVSDSETETETETETAPHESMVVVVQPPWILALQDMKNVSECTAIPTFPADGIPLESRLSSAQRVWANLHDSCKRQGCRSFALTTYHGWLFGRFDADWGSAEVSEVKEFGAREPSVMQALVYWVAKSMGLAGTRETVAVVTVDEDNSEPGSGGEDGS